jgi:hypothetical protein
MLERQVIKLLKPETELELQLIQLPELYVGLLWGEPRFGHPEGQVIYHIQEIYANIDQLHHLTTDMRAQLRVVALTHDSFKYQEEKSVPRNWEMHHGSIAMRKTASLIGDQVTRDLIELHDEAYYCWRQWRNLSTDDIKPRYTVETLLQRVEPFLIPYMLFFRCDTLTGDKNPAPLKWFEEVIAELNHTR